MSAVVILVLLLKNILLKIQTLITQFQHNATILNGLISAYVNREVIYYIYNTLIIH